MDIIRKNTTAKNNWLDFDNFKNQLLYHFLPQTGGWGVQNWPLTPESWIALNTYEKDGTLFVTADVPGCTKDDVTVTLDNHTLKIVATRESHEGTMHRTETYYGRQERSFTLPSDIDVDSCSAELTSGVLKLSFKKSSENTKRIEVK